MEKQSTSSDMDACGSKAQDTAAKSGLTNFSIDSILGLSKGESTASTSATCQPEIIPAIPTTTWSACNMQMLSSNASSLASHFHTFAWTRLKEPFQMQRLPHTTVPCSRGTLWPPLPAPVLHQTPSKGRKARTVFTAEQIDSLEQKFLVNKYLSVPQRLKIAEELELTEQQVKTWFQNRRTKWKRRLKEQDLADAEGGGTEAAEGEETETAEGRGNKTAEGGGVEAEEGRGISEGESEPGTAIEANVEAEIDS